MSTDLIGDIPFFKAVPKRSCFFQNHTNLFIPHFLQNNMFFHVAGWCFYSQVSQSQKGWKNLENKSANKTTNQIELSGFTHHRNCWVFRLQDFWGSSLEMPHVEAALLPAGWGSEELSPCRTQWKMTLCQQNYSWYQNISKHEMVYVYLITNLKDDKSQIAVVSSAAFRKGSKMIQTLSSVMLQLVCNAAGSPARRPHKNGLWLRLRSEKMVLGVRGLGQVIDASCILQKVNAHAMSLHKATH